ncbi:MAG: hypothetical protein IKT65_00500 [Clostridia bacterium]|jgi:diacylglycerol kinase family enzyme|nr:hypothetical protein [Clostridia bacterium]
MPRFNIINPAAGQGLAQKYANESDDNRYTTAIGDAEKIAREICDTVENAEITVYGGDGTLNEVVNGVIGSKYASSAVISAYPAGTGNDFLRYSNENVTVKCDTVKYNNNRHYVNILNIGFDCDVVIKTAEMKKKPFISGSVAYILSLVLRLFEKFGQDMHIEGIDENGERFTYDGSFTLCLAANGSYYGGGFNASPESNVNDGVFELVAVKKLSRLKFLSLVGLYKKGKHIQNNKPIKKFEDCIIYHKCKKACISGINYFCADGEIEYLNDEKQVDLEIAPNTFNFKF